MPHRFCNVCHGDPTVKSILTLIQGETAKLEEAVLKAPEFSSIVNNKQFGSHPVHILSHHQFVIRHLLEEIQKLRSHHTAERKEWMNLVSGLHQYSAT
jgi:hypothetical protein